MCTSLENTWTSTLARCGTSISNSVSTTSLWRSSEWSSFLFASIVMVDGLASMSRWMRASCSRGARRTACTATSARLLPVMMTFPEKFFSLSWPSGFKGKLRSTTSVSRCSPARGAADAAIGMSQSVAQRVTIPRESASFIAIPLIPRTRLQDPRNPWSCA